MVSSNIAFQQDSALSSVTKNTTLLILGENEVDKSIWINGFGNFLKYNTLNTAEDSPTLSLIPISFTVTGENYEDHVVSVDVTGEGVTSGKSGTEGMPTYSFCKDGHVIRLIDTPGDVTGLDTKNFQQTVTAVKEFGTLDGICIILSPKNAPLDRIFSVYVKQLLAHFHRDVCVVFCFTNCLPMFQRPGDTLPALRKLLSDIPELELSLNKNTMYCMSNDSILFLYAMTDAVEFTPHERQNYSINWDKSVSDVNRLLSFIVNQPGLEEQITLPPPCQSVLSPNEPEAKINENISETLEAKKKEHEVEVTLQGQEVVKTGQETPKEIHEEPRTVCTNVSCSNLVSIGQGEDTSVHGTEYRTTCHTNCCRGKKKSSDVVGIVGHKNLQKCPAFNKKGECQSCGCSWEFHMKTMEISKVEMNQLVHPDTEELLQKKHEAVEKVEVFLASVDTALAELQEDQNEVIKASDKFSCFLKDKAISPYNESIIEYITLCIDHERTLQTEDTGADRVVLIQRLEQMREIYETEIKLLNAEVMNGADDKPVNSERLKTCVDRLIGMKHNGELFKNYLAPEASEGKASTSIRTLMSFKRKITSEFKGIVSSLIQEKQQSMNASNKTGDNNVSDEELVMNLDLVEVANEQKNTSASDVLPSEREDKLSSSPLQKVDGNSSGLFSSFQRVLEGQLTSKVAQGFSEVVCSPSTPQKTEDQNGSVASTSQNLQQGLLSSISTSQKTEELMNGPPTSQNAQEQISDDSVTLNTLSPSAEVSKTQTALKEMVQTTGKAELVRQGSKVKGWLKSLGEDLLKELN